MAAVYILFSEHLNRFYIGSCEDLTFRIRQHRSQEFSGSFTAKVNDWKLFISIDDLGYEQARAIEKHIKKMKSKTYIQNLKAYPELILKLILKYK